MYGSGIRSPASKLLILAKRADCVERAFTSERTNLGTPGKSWVTAVVLQLLQKYKSSPACVFADARSRSNGQNYQSRREKGGEAAMAKPSPQLRAVGSSNGDINAVGTRASMMRHLPRQGCGRRGRRLEAALVFTKTHNGEELAWGGHLLVWF